MRYNVFLSYPWADKPAAAALYDRLVAAGLAVFRDDHEIRDTQSISDTISGALAESCLLVAWYSTAYARRRACQWELTAAWLAGAAEGNPAGRILVVNPLKGLGHIHPIELRNAPALPADDLDDAVRRILAHLARLTTPLGAVVGMAGGPWAGTRRGSSPRFVGRMAEMWHLHSALNSTANRAAMLGAQHTDTGLVHGLGGIGKSLLAEEYAFRFRAAYPGGTVWLSATAGDDKAEIYTLALHLRLPVQDETPEGVRALVRDHLAQRKPYLWIVDDLPSDADPQALSRWRAPTENGRTLITSRGTGLAGCVTPVALGVLSDDEAHDLLTSRRPPRDQAETAAARAIIRELGGHPLALDVAAAAVEHKSYGELQEEVSDRSREVLALAADLADHLPTGHDTSIVATLLHSIRRLDDNGLRVLQLAALLAVASIPVELVTMVWGAWAGRSWVFRTRRALAQRLRRRSFRMPVPDPPASRCKDLACKAIVAAKRESLMDQDGSLFVHALVSRVIQHHAPPPDALGAAAVDALNTAMSAVRDIREHGRLADWLPHALALSDAPTDAATLELLGWLGFYDRVRGNYPAAVAKQRRYLDMSRRVLGPEHLDTLTAMNNLAATLRAQGEYAAARALDEQVLAARQRLLGPEHPHTLTSMNNLAGTLWAQGEYAAARALHEQVLAARERLLGAEHPDTLTSMNNLAATLRALGEPAAARALHEQVLAISQRVLGAEHPDTLTAMNNLATTLRARGEPAAARALHEQVLAARERLLGAEHPDTLQSMNNLAETLRAQGEPAAARVLHEQVLAAHERLLGPEHPATLGSMNNLAWTLADLGDRAAAAALVARALPLSRARLGEAHELTRKLQLLHDHLEARAQAGADPV